MIMRDYMNRDNVIHDLLWNEFEDKDALRKAILLYHTDDEEIVMLAIDRMNTILRDMPYSVKSSVDIALFAIRKNVNNILYLDEYVFDFEEVVLEGIKRMPEAFIFASKRLQNDKKLIIRALRTNSYIYEYLKRKYKDDEEIVLELLMKNKRYINRLDNQYKILLSDMNEKELGERIKAVRRINELKLLQEKRKKEKDDGYEL